MNALLLRGGQATGLLGILLMAIAVVARLGGAFMLGRFQTGTLLLGGMAGLGVGSFLLLWVLAERSRS
jgi:hypothetical protein